MDAELAAVLLFLGMIGGFLAGLLGIGGGIILAPLLLYVPPLFGLAGLDMKVVSGLTITQGLFASLSGVVIHHRFRFVHTGLAARMGPAVVVAGFCGAWLSAAVTSGTLLGLFAVLAMAAAILMLTPQPRADREAVAEQVAFSSPLAVAVALTLAFLAGMVGQGGAFVLIPAMIYVLRIPTRVAIGTSLVLVLCSAAAGTAGKVAAGQVSWSLVAAMVPGALIGAQVGGRLSRRVPAGRLRHGLALLIAAAAFKMWYELLA